MPAKCLQCGENAVEEDGQYGQAHLICTSCGAVAEEGSLARSTSPHLNAFKDRGLAIRSKGRLGVAGGCYKTPSRGQKQGIEAISAMSSRLRVPSNCVQESKDLYKTALQQPSIKCITVHKKVFVAASCLYVVLRQANWPISVVTICRCIMCSIEDFSSGYRLLVRAINLQIKQPPIEDIIESFLNDLNFGEEMADVVKRTNHLIQLASHLWLSTGRSNAPLIHACAFFAWKSLSLDRFRTTYTQFCTTLAMHKSTTTNARVREVQAMLIELGKKIPWLDAKDVTATNVCRYLGDILKYSNSLRVDVCCNEQDMEEIEQIEDEEFKKFRRKRPVPLKEGNAVDPDQVFSEEIADEEIEQYIRSEKEVEIICQLYKKYGQAFT